MLSIVAWTGATMYPTNTFNTRSRRDSWRPSSPTRGIWATTIVMLCEWLIPVWMRESTSHHLGSFWGSRERDSHPPQPNYCREPTWLDYGGVSRGSCSPRSTTGGQLVQGSWSCNFPTTTSRGWIRGTQRLPPYPINYNVPWGTKMSPRVGTPSHANSTDMTWIEWVGGQSWDLSLGVTSSSSTTTSVGKNLFQRCSSWIIVWVCASSSEHPWTKSTRYHPPTQSSRLWWFGRWSSTRRVG